MPDPDPFDPIAEAHRQWSVRWPEHADHMAAVTSVMRVQQLLLARIEATLQPFGLTFAAYEALRLLAFTRSGSMPMGKMGINARWSIRPRSPTPSGGWSSAGWSNGVSPPRTGAWSWPPSPTAARTVARDATAALNQANFGIQALVRRRDGPAHVHAAARPGGGGRYYGRAGPNRMGKALNE